MENTLDQSTADALAVSIKASIAEIIKKHGPRPPGSPGERAFQKQLQQELKAEGIQTTMEAFPVAQKAFMAMPLVCALLMLSSLPLYWVAPLLAPLPILLAIVVFVCELLLYKHILSYVFPKTEALNLCAPLPARDTARQRILLVGHADGAYEWRLHRCFPRLFPYFSIPLILAFLYLLGTTLASAVTGGVFSGDVFWEWLGLSHAFVLPALLLGLLYTNFKVVSPGAADNLSGSLCVTTLVKWLKQSNLALKNTEITAIVTGCEEAGLEGAKAYVRAHRKELDPKTTVAIAVDTVSEFDQLAVYTKDLNGRVKHDKKVCALIRDAGKKCGVDLPDASITVGASDAAAFTQAGIPAAAICAMDHAPAHYYHNRRDLPEIVENACLAKTLQLLWQVCLDYDQSAE
ncbi:MAG: M20/M25/M40 family metallo-hydrolase [Candidatus Hydrogenedentales bacterium]